MTLVYGVEAAKPCDQLADKPDIIDSVALSPPTRGISPGIPVRAAARREGCTLRINRDELLFFRQLMHSALCRDRRGRTATAVEYQQKWQLSIWRMAWWYVDQE